MKSLFLTLVLGTTALALGATAPVAAQGSGRAGPLQTDTLRLTLDDALTRALRQGDEVRLAETQVDIADAQVTAARATALPQLRLNSNYQHVVENARAQAVGSIFGQNNTYNSNLVLSQTLFQGGRVLAANRAARRTGDAVRLDASEVQAQMVVDVQRAYLNALFARRIVQIQDSAVVLASERLAQVERLEQGGRAARFDVLRARVERANLEPLAIRARTDEELALLEVKRLLNVPAEQPMTLASTLDAGDVLAAVSARPDSAAPPVADARPAVRSAELVTQARQDAIRVARADYLPTVGISGVFGYLAFPTGGFLQNVPTSMGRLAPVTCPPDSSPDRVCSAQNGGWFSDRSVAITVSWPLFDGLRTKANVELAQAQAQVADLQLAQTRERVAIEVASARSEVARARSAFQAQQQTVAEANEAYGLASLRFQRGLGTQLEASDAQLALLLAQINEARAVYDVFLAAAELARAEGRPIPLPTGGTAPLRTSSLPDTSRADSPAR